MVCWAEALFHYIPLMFVGYAMLRKEGDLRRFLVVNMLLAAVISLVGILQTIVGLDFLNPHGGADIEELGAHGAIHTLRNSCDAARFCLCE